MKRATVLCVSALMLAASAVAQQVGEADLLMPAEAFRLSVAPAGDRLRLQWAIAEGYYLYRSKFRFRTDTPGVSLGDPDIPPGEVREDEFFGRVEILRKRAVVELPLKLERPVAVIALQVTSQGCADIGVCYPPYTQTVRVDAPAPNQAALRSTVSTADAEAAQKGDIDPLAALAQLTRSFGGDVAGEEFLEPDSAFVLTARVRDGKTLGAGKTDIPNN